MFHEANCSHSYATNANHNYAASCHALWMKEPISQRIKRHRKQRGLTQQQVGDAIGVSRVAVSRWESGSIKDMKRENLIGMARLFQITLDELLDTVTTIGDQVADDPDELVLLEHFRHLTPHQKRAMLTICRTFVEDIEAGTQPSLGTAKDGSERRNSPPPPQNQKNSKWG